METMTQEDKELLIKDLCARLPYGVKIVIQNTFKYSIVSREYHVLDVSNFSDIVCFNYKKFDKRMKKAMREHPNDIVIKPYLFPMSSMTEEEKRILQSFYPMSFGNQYLDLDKEKIELYECNSTMEFYLDDSVQMVDFCKKNHLDCYGLIKEGLALSTDEYNPYND